MKKLNVILCSVFSAMMFLTQSFTANAGFDLQHYEMTDDGLWLIQAKGASGNTEEGRVTIHLFVDNSNRDIAYINNYYCANYYDENGNFQESAIHYYPEDMVVETTINGYEVWTNDYGYPVGDWFFAGYSSGYGSLPETHTLTTDFQYTDESNSKLTPFTVTKDGTVHIFAIQGDQDFIDANLNDFISWAKDRQNGLDTEKNLINGGESISVQEEELQTVEIIENSEPEPTKTPLPAATQDPTEEKQTVNWKTGILSGLGLAAIIGALLFLTRRKR